MFPYFNPRQISLPRKFIHTFLNYLFFKGICLIKDDHFQGFILCHILAGPVTKIFLAPLFQSTELVFSGQLLKGKAVSLKDPKILIRVNTLKKLLYFCRIFPRISLANFSLKFDDNMDSKTGEDKIKTAR